MLTPWRDVRQAAASRWRKFSSNLCVDSTSWTTLILTARLVDDQSIWGRTIAEVSDDLGSFKKLWRSVVRKRIPGTRWCGAFEIDLLRPEYLVSRAHKVALLADLGVDVMSLTPGDRVVLPHFHAVVDLHRDSSCRFTREMGRAFPGRRRLLCKPLWKQHSLCDNVERLCSYTYKRQFKYSSTDDTGSSVFVANYESLWYNRMSQLYDHLQDNIAFESWR